VGVTELVEGNPTITDQYRWQQARRGRICTRAEGWPWTYVPLLVCATMVVIMGEGKFQRSTFEHL
jgi:hypothetical protein